tara:strand:+ start:409 stop:1155 length:747 start_codon:yes stop_codon:yes gene_type:complete
MNTLEANIRSTKTKGELNTLRSQGNVPAVIYGGQDKNQNISVSKKTLINLLERDNFLSNIIKLKIDGKDQNVLPRDVKFDILSDEPTHVDFLRIVKGGKVILQIPVKFINSDKSPGLKRGGVLNIVRRKVELKCPTENIPNELIVDLDGVDIGQSFKISAIKLPENVHPTIQGRDFVVATLAAPTVIKEPEKPAEAAEGAEATGEEGATQAAEGAEGDGKAPPADATKSEKKDDAKKGDDKKSQPEKK